MRDLLEYLTKALVDSPEAVSVESFEEDDGTLVLELHVASDDIGKVIGRSGRTVNALRTVIRASAVKQGRRRDPWRAAGGRRRRPRAGRVPCGRSRRLRDRGRGPGAAGHSRAVVRSARGRRRGATRPVRLRRGQTDRPRCPLYRGRPVLP